VNIEDLRAAYRDECALHNQRIAGIMARLNRPTSAAQLASNLADLMETSATLWVAGLYLEASSDSDTVDAVAQQGMHTATEIILTPDSQFGIFAPHFKAHMASELLGKAMGLVQSLAPATDTPQAAAPAVA
jgi:hypothetical protein